MTALGANLGIAVSKFVAALVTGSASMLARGRLVETAGPRHGHRLVLPGVVLIGVYGGYFGAGIGILMLASLGLLGFTNIHQMNGLKTTGAAIINGIAALYFIFAGVVLWWVVAAMGVGSITGGFLASRAAYRVGREAVKRAVVVIGIAMTVALLVRLYA